MPHSSRPYRDEWAAKSCEQRETVKAAKSDKMQSFCFLEPFQTVRHGSDPSPARIWPQDPLIAIKPR